MADEQEIDWAPPDGRLIDLPAGACFVRVSGRDDPAIVLLHGVANDSRVYGRLQPALAAAHRTIAPDFFGWGFSDPNDGLSLGFDTLDRTLDQLIDALELDRVVVVAQGMSGPSAIRWAASAPDRAHALVLLNTYFGWNSARMPPMLKLLHLPGVGRLVRRFIDIGHTGISWHAYRWQVGRLWASTSHENERMLRVFQSVFRHSTTARRAFHTINDEIVDQIDENQRNLETLTSLDVPTLVLWGQRDPYLKPAVARQFHRLIPRSELHMVANAGHFVQLEASQEVAGKIMSFVARAR